MTLDISTEVHDLFRKKVMEFLDWSEANWTLKEEDRAKDQWVAEKSADYLIGYNAGVEAMKGAFECWNEEFL